MKILSHEAPRSLVSLLGHRIWKVLAMPDFWLLHSLAQNSPHSGNISHHVANNMQMTLFRLQTLKEGLLHILGRERPCA